MEIRACNVRTGHQVGNREIIIRESLRFGIFIAVLSELRLTGSGSMRVQAPNSGESILLYYSGGSKHVQGVGFAVNQTVSNYVTAFQPVSSRLAVLPVSGAVNTHIIAVYGLTKVSSDEAKDDFYSQLQEMLGTLPRKDLVLVVRDLNTRVGKNQKRLGRCGG